MLRAFIERLFSGAEDWDGSDRRLGLRARCDIELEVACPGLRYLGRALDVGPRGVRIRIRGPWNPRVVKKGQAAQLKYLTPLFDAELDTVQSKIMWVKKEVENVFQIGVQFDDTVENLRRSWIKPILLKSLKARVQQKRKQLRVRSNIPCRLQLEGKEYDANLRDLSVGGGLLECFQGFKEGTQFDVMLRPGKPHADVPLKAIVRRGKLNLGTYQMGVAFIGDERLKKVLLKLLKAMVEIEGKNRL